MPAPSNINKDVSRSLVPWPLRQGLSQAAYNSEYMRDVWYLSQAHETTQESFRSRAGLAALAGLGCLIISGLAQRDVCAGTDGSLGAFSAIEVLAGDDSVDFLAVSVYHQP